MPFRDAAHRRLRRLTKSLFFIPVCIVIAVVVLGSFKVSGTSIGLLAENDPSPQSALQLRPGRSDEWRGRTPMVLRQAANGFPATTNLGIGIHDAGVLSDLPVKSAAAVIKPHSWLYFVLDVERAFAIEWWMTVLGPLLGVYAVMAVLTRSRAVSALTGLLVAAAPAATWWTVPSMCFSVLYGGLCLSAFLVSLQRTGRPRFAWAALSGWLLGCFAALLYVPWLIPLGLLFGAIALSQLRGQLRQWKRLTLVLTTGGAVFAVVMLVYLREHRAALQAISASVYPGQRVVHSGEAIPALVFDAPLDVFTTRVPAPAVSGTNTSEAASGLMLWVPVLLAGGAFSGFRSRSAVPRALAAVLTASLVLAAWALLPVPDKFGVVLGLSRVQGSRLALPLTVAGALAAGLYVHRMRTDGSFRPERNRRIIGAVVFAFGTGALMMDYTVDLQKPSSAAVFVLLAILFAVTLAILDGRTMIGLAGAGALLMFSAVRVNPLQVGLGPVRSSPLTAQIASIRTGDPTGLWAVSGLDDVAVSIVMASGAPSATGVSWYADPLTWRTLDPDASEQYTWDRFAYVSMVVDDTLPAQAIDLPYADAITIETPSCDGALQRLGVQYMVSKTSITSPCLGLIARPTATGERFIYSTTLTGP